MINYHVVFMGTGNNQNVIGSCNELMGYPPSQSEIDTLESELQRREGFDKVTILNWIPLSD